MCDLSFHCTCGFISEDEITFDNHILLAPEEITHRLCSSSQYKLHRVIFEKNKDITKLLDKIHNLESANDKLQAQIQQVTYELSHYTHIYALNNLQSKRALKLLHSKHEEN